MVLRALCYNRPINKELIMGYQEQAMVVTGLVVFGVAGAALAITALVLVWSACTDALRERQRRAKFKAFCKPRF
jgi:hypothetical protein